MDHEAEYVAHMRARNLRPSTIYQRRRVLARLRAWAGADPIGLDRAQVAAWLASRDLAPESRSTELSHLRGFYRWAAFEGHIPVDPTAMLPRPKVPRHLPRPMTATALKDAVNDAPDRVRLAVVLAAYGGLRACEIAQLRGEHYTLDGERPILRIVESKGGSESSVPMHPELVAELSLWPRRGPVWPRHDGKLGHATPHLVSATVNGWLHRHGHTDTLHRARHWFGTGVYQSTGRDLRAAQELLRHRSVVSTQIYTYVDPGPLVAAVASLPKVA
jgi:integrase